MLYRRKVLLILFKVTTLMLSFQAAAQLEISERWSITKKFVMPESAVFDSGSGQIFVSNVNNYAKDGNGFVSRVSADGKDIALKWLTGLNSPTGLAVKDGLLYVVDYDQLHIVDITKGKIITSADSPHEKPALNDVAISPSGRVLVSGSASAAIYELIEGQLQVWKQDKLLLKHANGLFVDNSELVFGGTHWKIFDLDSKDIAVSFTSPTPAIREIDGITSDSCGGYFITLIDDDRLWQVSASSVASPVSEQAIKGIDIDRHESRLYVPTVGGGLSVFELEGVCA